MTMIMVITKKPIKMGMGMIRILENKYQKMNKKEIAYWKRIIFLVVKMEMKAILTQEIKIKMESKMKEKNKITMNKKKITIIIAWIIPKNQENQTESNHSIPPNIKD